MTITQTLQRQIAHGPTQVPIDPDEAVEAARDSQLVRLLIALTDDQSVHLAWARATDFADLDAAGRLAWMRADLEEVDDEIDTQLAGDDAADTIDLLARSGLGWAHEALNDGLDRDATREEAAMVLARSQPGELRPALIEAEVVDDVVTLLRAAAVEGAAELWDQFLIWRERLDDIDGIDEATRREYAARLEGAGAALAPTLFARGLLAGDYGIDWLGERAAVADFLQVYGPTDWLEVVGLLELADVGPAEDLAATLAVAAAAGIQEEPPADEEVEDLLDLLAETPTDGEETGDWESLATGLGFGFQVAMGEGDFALLLAQVAAHERLVTHGIHSPGIPGLPLSATSQEDLDASAVTDLMGDYVSGPWTDEHEVSALRTLCDGRVWARRTGEREGLARSVASMVENVTRPAVETARAQLFAALDEARRDWEGESFEEDPTLRRALIVAAGQPDDPSEALLETLADGSAERETPLGLDCLRALGEQNGERVLEVLGELWAERLSPLRAPFARRVLEEAIAVRA